MSRDARLLALKDVADIDGRLTAEALIQAARPPGHPLHNYFEWDDSKAGHQWRLHQARQLIATARMKFTTTKLTLDVPMFLRDPEQMPRSQGHRLITSIAQDPASARASLAIELGRAQALIQRARATAAVLGLADECEKVLTQLLALVEVVKNGDRPEEPE